MEVTVIRRATRPLAPPIGERMAAHIGSLEGGRVVVIGNGPSLLHQDLGWLEDEITIGVNRAYMLPRYNETLPAGWSPTYAIWTDHRKVNFRPTVYQDCRATFVYRKELEGTHANARDWPGLVPWDGTTRYRTTDGRPFAIERGACPRGLVMAGTTSISAVHLAFVLGADEVGVIGCDHGHDDDDRTHFYSPPGVIGLIDIRATLNSWQVMLDAWRALAPAWPGPVIDLGKGRPGLGEAYRAAA